MQGNRFAAFSSNSSSSSAAADSISQLQNVHDLRLLQSAAANSSGGGSDSGGSSIRTAAAVDDAKQLQLAGVVQLVAFCVFEVLIGMFWPSMMTLRAKHVPEQQRSTIINVFRIPLNLFVCLILWKVGWAGARLHLLHAAHSVAWLLVHTCTGRHLSSSQAPAGERPQKDY